MATLFIDNKEFTIDAHNPIANICEKAGVPFSCQSGCCGTCQIEVMEGADILSPLSQQEDTLGMDPNHRLACQCIITKGTVKITY